MPGQQPKQSLVGRTIQSTDSTTPISYKITEWLRSTSVLETYLAVHTAVALKIELQVLAPALTAQADFATRFISQLKALVALNVPSLAKVYDYGRDGGYFFIVIEHHKSPTLRAKLETDGRLPLNVTLNNARLIGETLGYAASQGVLHGLLSSDVVTLSSRRGPVLDHFGLTPLLGLLLTHVLTDDPQLGGYTAPELLNGQPVSTASDLYSLTALTYEMATGKQPYSGLTPTQAVGAPIPDPAQLDPALAPLTMFIRRGLAKDPAARFLSYSEFNSAIQSVIAAVESAAAAPAKRPVAQVSVTPPPPPVPPAKMGGVEQEAVGHTLIDGPAFVSAATHAPAPLDKTETVEEGVGGRTIADMPAMVIPPSHVPASLGKTEAVEEDAGGHTIADMPAIMPSAARSPAASVKTESVENDAGGRTIADMPAVAPPAPPRPVPASPPRAAAPVSAAPAPMPTPPAKPKAAEEDFSGRTMLELPGAMPSAPPIPPSFPSSSAGKPSPAYPAPQATIPRQVEQRYRTEPISDDRSASSPPSAVPYNFSSVPPTYAGGQRSTPGQFNDRYGTRQMDRANLEGSAQASGITGFISTPAAGIPNKRRRSPALLIIVVLIVLLLIAGAIGFTVLHYVLHVF